MITRQVLVTDLQVVRQAAVGEAGVTHCVQGFSDEPFGTLHQRTDPHVGHVGGHYARNDTLEKSDFLFELRHHQDCNTDAAVSKAQFVLLR